ARPILQGERRDDRHHAGGAERLDQLRIDALDRADEAEIDRPAVVAGEGHALAEEDGERGAMQADGAAAELPNGGDDAGVDFVDEDADDDLQRGGVGVAAALDLAGDEAGGGHGAVDRLAAAVDEDWAQPDGGHEDDILKGGLQGV